MPPRDPPDVSIGKEGPCKLPVRSQRAWTDRVRDHKSVRVAYYSHVGIHSRAGKLARFPSTDVVVATAAAAACLPLCNTVQFFSSTTRLFPALLFRLPFPLLPSPRFIVACLLLSARRDVYGARRTERAFLRSRWEGGEGGRGGGGARRSFGRYLSERMVESFVARRQLLEKGGREGGMATGSGFSKLWLRVD